MSTWAISLKGLKFKWVASILWHDVWFHNECNKKQVGYPCPDAFNMWGVKSVGIRQREKETFIWLCGIGYWAMEWLRVSRLWGQTWPMTVPMTQTQTQTLVMGSVWFNFFALKPNRIEPNQTIDIKQKPKQTVYELSTI